MSAFVGPKTLLKTQFFEKKATFLVKKRFWSIFFRNIELEKCQGTTFKGSQGNLTIFVEIKRAVLWDLRGR